MARSADSPGDSWLSEHDPDSIQSATQLDELADISRILLEGLLADDVDA